MEKSFKIGFTYWQFSFLAGSAMLLLWQSPNFPFFTSLLGFNYMAGLFFGIEHYHDWKKERWLKK